jgi:hypothetical protein
MVSLLSSKGGTDPQKLSRGSRRGADPLKTLLKERTEASEAIR